MGKRTVEVLIKAKDLTKQAVDSAGKGFKDLQTTLANNAQLMGMFGHVVAATVVAMGAATTAVYKFLDATATMEDNLAKAAKRAQTDIETYGEWSHVIQLAGGSAGLFEKAIAALSKQMLNARNGSTASVDAFKDLGISVKTSSGDLKAADVTFEEVINSLSKMEDKTKRAALAQVLLGQAGKMLNPVLDQTSSQLSAQRDEYGRLGGDAISAAAKTGEEWVKAQLRVTTATDGLRAQFLSSFGPEIVTLINGVAKSIAILAKSLDNLDAESPLKSMDEFVASLQQISAMAVPSIKALYEIDNALRLIASGQVWKFDEQLGRTVDALIELDKAALNAVMSKRDLTLTFPGSKEGAEQLSTYNDLLKLSRKELEELAKKSNVAITVSTNIADLKIPDLPDLTQKVKYDVSDFDIPDLTKKLEIKVPEIDLSGISEQIGTIENIPPIDLSNLMPREAPSILIPIDVAKSSEQIAADLVLAWKDGADKAVPDIRARLENIAAHYNISTTKSIFDPEKLIWIDKARTSEKIAEDITNAAKEGFARAGLELANETKITVAADLEGGEALADNLQGIVVSYEDIIAAQKAIKLGSDEWLEKEKLLYEQVEQLRMIFTGMTFRTPIEETEDLTEGIESAAIVANGLGRGLGDIFVEAPFKAMAGDAVDFASVMKTTVMSALKGILKQLLIIKAVNLFGKAFGLEKGGQVPGNFGQAPIGFSGGGSIPRAAYGYSVPDGLRGQDSRLIMAMPGEEVINRQLAQRLDRFIRAQEGAAYASPYGSGSSSTGSNTVVMNVGIPDSMAGLQRMTDGIVERLSEGGVV